MDTDMTAGITDPKSDPSAVARIALDGIEKESPKILADQIGASVLGMLTKGVAGI
jgi:hypothetical protein